jgi:two-component system sporulation sensor kinase B
MADTVSSYIHELNNPLSNIYMLSQVMEAENDITSMKQYISLLKQSVQQLKDIQADYNEYRKTGKNPIKLSSVNLSAMLSSIVDEYRIMAATKNVRIIPSIRPCKIFTDGAKLKQAVSNIISNSIKYNVNKGTVSVCCVGSAGKAEIKIIDTGIGMDSDELKQIGTPFYRSKKTEVTGTGLGFSLVKKIADNLGWGLSVTSEVGVGTTVTLSVQSVAT